MAAVVMADNVRVLLVIGCHVVTLETRVQNALDDDDVEGGNI